MGSKNAAIAADLTLMRRTLFWAQHVFGPTDDDKYAVIAGLATANAGNPNFKFVVWVLVKGNLFVRVQFGVVLSIVEVAVRVRLCFLLLAPQLASRNQLLTFY